MLFIWILCTVLGLTLFYATLAQQKLFAKALAIQPWRALGLFLTVLGVLSSVSYLPVNEAFLVWLLLLVVMVGLLPFVPDLWSRKDKRQAH